MTDELLFNGKPVESSTIGEAYKTHHTIVHDEQYVCIITQNGKNHFNLVYANGVLRQRVHTDDPCTISILPDVVA